MSFIPFGIIEIQQHDPENAFEGWSAYPDPSRGWDYQIDVTRLLAEAWRQSAAGFPSVFLPIFNFSGSTRDTEQERIRHRGLPEDMGMISNIHYEDCGATVQGESWLFWREVKEMVTPAMDKNWHIILGTMTAFAKWCEKDKVRLIVWWAEQSPDGETLSC